MLAWERSNTNPSHLPYNIHAVIVLGWDNRLIPPWTIYFVLVAPSCLSQHETGMVTRPQGKTDRHLISLVGKVTVYRAGGLGSTSGRTNTQDLKIIEEKVLPLL